MLPERRQEDTLGSPSCTRTVVAAGRCFRSRYNACASSKKTYAIRFLERNVRKEGVLTVSNGITTTWVPGPWRKNKNYRKSDEKMMFTGMKKSRKAQQRHTRIKKNIIKQMRKMLYTEMKDAEKHNEEIRVWLGHCSKIICRHEEQNSCNINNKGISI